MKRIIAFVLFGLMVYAGGFALFFGLYDANRYSDETVYNFNSLNAESFKDGMIVDGHVTDLKPYNLNMGSAGDSIDEIYNGQATIFGIPVGKRRDYKRYLMDVPNTDDKRYCIIMFPIEDAEQIAASVQNGETVKFHGVIQNSKKIKAKNGNPFLANPDSNIIPYVIFVTDTSKLFEYLPSIIVGAVLILTGGGGAFLLYRRIKSEKGRY